MFPVRLFLFLLFAVVAGSGFAAAQTDSFVHPHIASDAARYEAYVSSTFAPANAGESQTNAADLLRAGREQLAGDARAASSTIARAVAAKPSNGAAWTLLAEALLAIPTNTLKGAERYDTPVYASGAAYLGYQRAANPAEKANALDVLSRSLVRRSFWRPAVDASRLANETVPTAQRAETYKSLRETHGFRMTDYRVEAERAEPRVCLVFSEVLARAERDFDRFVSVGGGDAQGLSIEASDLCIGGLAHGERFEVKVRAGVPSDVGETLLKDINLAVYVPDRKPSVRFSGKAYVLPSRGQQGLPVVSVNTDAVDVEVFRVGDRSLAQVVQNGDLLRQLSTWDVSTLKNRSGEKIYQGQLEVSSKLNAEVTTAFPVDEAIGRLKPGVYAMIASASKVADARYRSQVATQWFIVSDVGLTAFSADNGVHGFVRSLAETTPVAGVEVRLVARNNEILARAKSDASGHVHFDKAAALGEGGLAPALLIAQHGRTDYAFLDLSANAFDLSDRGVAGREPAGAIDAFIASERGVYRPGEEINLTALVRTREGRSSSLPVTLIVTRPDGVEHRRTVLSDQGLGGRVNTLALTDGAMTGTWRARVHLDPEKPQLAETAFLVEDFVPERLELKLTAPETALKIGETVEVAANGRFLYGPPAAGLGLEGEITVRPSKSGLKGFEGYVFGLEDEEITPVRAALSGLAPTSSEGSATIPVRLPAISRTSKALEAKVVVRLREPGGRTVERSTVLPVELGLGRIGIKPGFKNRRIGEGETAKFEVVRLDGRQTVSKAETLRWTLYRLETRWQWYNRNGYWSYDSMTFTRKAEEGEVSTGSDGSPASLAMRVGYGRYKLEVASADPGGPVASLVFNAGWYGGGSDIESPEMLDVALDRAVYEPGDTAKLRIADRAGGRALVSVLAGDFKSFREVEIPAGGGSVDIPVEADWGAGAYVAAMLYRPMDVGSKRMPSRAVGVSWLSLDQSSRTLNIALSPPEKISSSEDLTIPVSVSGLAPGEDARVVVAAVDVGVLNLTRFRTPDPESWFYGQTRLGVGIRDYYGRLIDGMRAERGALRSGGDGAGGVEMSGSPRSEKIVSLHSGLVRVDADGKAEVSFDVPEFNGTVRVMAMAWSAGKLGHAEKDVTVRDAVAVTITHPRFLTAGDTARVSVGVHNVEGEAGDYAFDVARVSDPMEGASVSNPVASKVLGLDEGQRTLEVVDIAAAETGIKSYTVSVKGPAGLSVARSFAIEVMPAGGDVKRTTVSKLQPGGSLVLSRDLIDDLVSQDARVHVSVGPMARFDVAGLLTQLDRYPYGCAEQTISRALPLLYVNDVAAKLGIVADAKARKRVRDAIDRVFEMQNASGAFGTWGPGGSDLWLTAYVADFLTRAREKGYEVSARGMGQALDRLQNYVAYAQDFKRGGETRAYALYVLARNKRAPIGELRYYADTRIDRFATPLAKAHLGAALAMMGDAKRASSAFSAALADFDKAETAGPALVGLVNHARYDFGSGLRDGAAVLALMRESGPQASGLAGGLARDAERLSDVVAAAYAAKTATSTQEQAWLLLAAHAVMEDRASDPANPFAPGISVAGVPSGTEVTQTFTAGELSFEPVLIRNEGEQAVDAVVSVVGSALKPEPAIAKGFAISRRAYALDGSEIQLIKADGSPAEVAQNTRAVMVLEVRTEAKGGRLLVVDRLPAGFEIENPRLVSSGDVKALTWLKPGRRPDHTEFRNDRFVASFNLTARRAANVAKAGTTLKMAYIVRAVSPGRYVHPALSVEDMYRPEAYARTGTGEIVVKPAGGR